MWGREPPTWHLGLYSFSNENRSQVLLRESWDCPLPPPSSFPPTWEEHGGRPHKQEEEQECVCTERGVLSRQVEGVPRSLP